MERVARNRDSIIAKDNLGKTGTRPIIKAAPQTIKSTLPIGNIAKKWSQEGIAYNLSENAGGFLCNHVFYTVLHWLTGHGLINIPCGFMHIGRSEEDLAESRKAALSMLTLLQ